MLFFLQHTHTHTYIHTHNNLHSFFVDIFNLNYYIKNILNPFLSKYRKPPTKHLSNKTINICLLHFWFSGIASFIIHKIPPLIPFKQGDLIENLPIMDVNPEHTDTKTHSIMSINYY